MADAGGVWRTVGGRRIFIKDGQDLEDAMRESGKFENNNKKFDELKEKFKDEEITTDNGIEVIHLQKIPYELNSGPGGYNDTTQNELNKNPVMLNTYSDMGTTCNIYKNKSDLLKDVEKSYGGFKQYTDGRKIMYGIASASGIGEYYLYRDSMMKSGWVWKDANDTPVSGYEYKQRKK